MCDLEIIPQATGKVIAQVIASAFYACCNSQEFMWLNTNHLIPVLKEMKRLEWLSDGQSPRVSNLDVLILSQRMLALFCDEAQSYGTVADIQASRTAKRGYMPAMSS